METAGTMPAIFLLTLIAGTVRITTRITIHITVHSAIQTHGLTPIIVRDGQVHLVITGVLPGITDGVEIWAMPTETPTSTMPGARLMHTDMVVFTDLLP